MEVIIARFEMQMRPCILPESALCLDVFLCVFCLGVSLAYNDNASHFSLSAIVCASTGDERNRHSGEMAVQAEDWSQVKER